MQYQELFLYEKSLYNDGYAITGFIGDNINTLIIPGRYMDGDIVAIAEGAFSDSAVQEVIMTSGVRVIESSAFCSCTQLRQVIFPNSLIDINEAAFTGCINLNTVILPDRVERIGAYAFAASGIKETKLPDSIYHLGEGAYSHCVEMTAITIPPKIEELSDRLFEECVSLKKVKLPGGLTSIGAYTFSGCINLTYIEIPDSVEIINEGAFQNVHEKFVMQCGRGSIGEEYARKNKLSYQLTATFGVRNAKNKSSVDDKESSANKIEQIKADSRANSEPRKNAEKAIKSETIAKIKAEAMAKAATEARLRAEAKVKEELAAKARAEKAAKEQAEARIQAAAKAREDAEAHVKAIEESKIMAEARIKAEAEAKAKAIKEERLRTEAIIKAETEALARAAEEARLIAEAKEREETEARAVAEAKMKIEKEAREKAEAKAREEAEARIKAEAKAKKEAEARIKAEALAKSEAEARARIERERVKIPDPPTTKDKPVFADNIESLDDVRNVLAKHSIEKAIFSKDIYDLVMALDSYKHNSEVAAETIKRLFPPPQMAYDKFMGDLEDSDATFLKLMCKGADIIGAAVKRTAKRDEIITKIKDDSRSLAELCDDLSTVLINKYGDSSGDDESTTAVEVLVSDLQTLIESVKNYA